MAPSTVPRRSRPDRTGAPKRRRATAPPDNFTARVGEWWRNKRLFDTTRAALDGDKDKTKPGAVLGLRLEVLEQVKRSGTPDEKGSRFYHFTEPVDGLAGLKAQRGGTPTFDLEKAEEKLRAIGGQELVDQCSRTVLVLEEDKHHLVEKALREAGLYDECVQTRDTEIVQDAVFGYHQLNRDKLTAADMDELTPLVETWSLIPIPVKSQ